MNDKSMGLNSLSDLTREFTPRIYHNHAKPFILFHP